MINRGSYRPQLNPEPSKIRKTLEKEILQMWTYCNRHLLLLIRDNAAVPGATLEQTEPLVSLLGNATGCVLTELRQGWPRLVECEATALGEAVAEHRLTAKVVLQTPGFLLRRKALMRKPHKLFVLSITNQGSHL